MGDTEKRNTDMMQQRIHSSFATSSCSIPKQTLSMNHQLDVPQLNPQFTPSHHLPQLSQSFNGSGENGGRIRVPPSHPSQIPPISPYSHIPITRQPSSQNFTSAPTHSRSLSQPSSFFSFDSLPPLSPSPYHDSPSASISDHDISMEDSETRVVNSSLPALHFSRANGNSSRIGENLPPRKRSHRRSNSDIPYGFNPLIQNSPPLFPPKGLERSVSGGESSQWPKISQLMKKEPNWERSDDSNREGEVVDDLFSAYMNLDNIDVLNSSGAEEINKSNENREDLDSSRVSMTKTNGCNSSDTEAESSVNESQNSYQKIERTYSSGEKTGSVKRSAGGDARHYRSISMDSCFMGKLNFGDESLNLPPSPGGCSVQLSPSNSAEGNSLSLEFGSSEFTAVEMKKIMGNEKLAEIALTDPKRVKRILANRQSAARSKERKMRYIAELEHKVQTLQTEATTLSAQLTLLQRDSLGLTNQNNELKFRLQAMDQQTQLRDALNEALTAEVQRLKLEMGARESDHSKSLSVSPEMFQQQLSIHQSQQNQLQQKDQRQIKNEEAKPNSN